MSDEHGQYLFPSGYWYNEKTIEKEMGCIPNAAGFQAEIFQEKCTKAKQKKKRQREPE